MNKIKTAYEKVLKGCRKFYTTEGCVRYKCGEILYDVLRLCPVHKKALEVFIERCRDELAFLKGLNIGFNKLADDKKNKRITDLKEVLDLSEGEGK